MFAEAEHWNLWDVNVRVGPSGIHGELALEAPALLAEMDRYFIRHAVVAHQTGIEYDADTGNRMLSELKSPRLTPAFSGMPERESVERLEKLEPKAVRLTPGSWFHNFPLNRWGAGELLELLQSKQVLTLVAREDLPWNDIADLLESFPRLPLVLLDTGYRADRFLLPLLQRFPSLYFDSATYLAHRQLESFVERFGPDRILFGSKLPLFTPASSLAVLATARMGMAARAAIAGGNLRRLLRMEDTASAT
jgi:hypothetical protein